VTSLLLGPREVPTRDLRGIPEGEWSAEAVGPKIQGNPLKLNAHRLFFFDLALPERVCVPTLSGVPRWGGTEQDLYDGLRAYLVAARSHVNPEVGIEGIVWHGFDGYGGKLKLKDFTPARPGVSAHGEANG
jgi:hypothetical protein